MLKHKLKAFSVHFLASLAIAAISLIIVFFVWYPQPLYQATGVTRIFLIILGIDIVLGPILTFIVYKPNKRTLKFDLSVILLLQLSALIYGLYNVYDGRPAWIVFNVDRFDLVKNNEIDTRKLVQATSKYQKVSSTGVKYVAAIIPEEDREVSQQILFDEISYGIAPSQRPELYKPLDIATTEMMKRAKDIEELYDYNDRVEVDNIISKYPKADGFLPLKASVLDMTVLINKQDNSQVLDIVDLRPW